MPVSATQKAITERAASSRPCPGVQPDCAGAMASETPPCLVNLNALASRFFSTCLRRPRSVLTRGGSAGSMETENCRPLPCATCWKLRSRSSRSSSSRPGATLTAVRAPDSIFARSSRSLISESRSMPDAWMVCANCTSLAVRLPPALSASRRARISRLLSGVRSSCDMLARNCDFASLAFSATTLARISSASTRLRSVRSRVTLAKPRSLPVSSRTAVTTALAQNVEPSLRTHQPSCSKRPSAFAASSSTWGLPRSSSSRE